ncbi:MAG: ArsR family transcriptional regulator [Oceanospirillales bacterium]|nr:MAG: ArsR family transcriptional regulator [Oceanospirillales bacterium]
MEAVVFFKCLSDATRLRIVTLLKQKGELCVCDLMSAMGESQPKISRHLAQLRTCGLLQDSRRGQWVYYSIHNSLVDWAHDALSSACIANERQLQSDLKRLEGHPSNSCQ